MNTYLAPPNDGVDQICYLTFGRDDYDDSEAVRAYHRELNEWWKNGKSGPHPVHWRKRVRDPNAGLVIYEDPDHQPTNEDGYRRHWLYEPSELQELLINTPRLIRAIHFAVEQDYDITSARRVYKELLSVLRTEYRPVWETWYDRKNTGRPLSLVSSGNKEADWKKAIKYLEQTAELIAGCLYQHYENNPHEWSVNVIKYGEPSESWLNYLDKVARRTATPKVERIGGVSSSFVLDNGEAVTTAVPVSLPPPVAKSSFVED
jgi:hypothetical protein